MSSLSEARRWINVSKIEQRIWNDNQYCFHGVAPLGFVEGGHWEKELRGNPFFRETTKHLAQKTFFRLIQDETDLGLLDTMLTLEEATENRETTVQFLKARIKTVKQKLVSSVA